MDESDLQKEEEKLNRLLRVQRALLNYDTPSAQRMRQENAAEAIRTEGLMRRLRAQLLDTLMVNDTLDKVEELGLEEGSSGLKDRARHMIWMQNLASRYGPGVARTIGTLHEAKNIFDPIRIAWRDIPKMRKKGLTAETINERQFEAMREISRDLQTNETALKLARRGPDGEYLPPDPEQIKRFVQRLRTRPTPEEGRMIADPVTIDNLFKGEGE